MSRKFNYSIEIDITEFSGFPKKEKLEVTGCDSFDEALFIVEKGLKDRLSQIESQIRKTQIEKTKIEELPELPKMSYNEGNGEPSTTTPIEKIPLVPGKPNFGNIGGDTLSNTDNENKNINE